MLTLRKGEKLQVLLAGAVNTNECPMTARWESASDAGRAAGTQNDGITTGATAVDLLVGEGGGKRVVGFSFYNADLATVTVTVRLYNKNGTTRTIRKHTLLTLESLYWDQVGGWYCSDASGNQKMATAAADSGNISLAQSTATVGSSQASSIAAAIVPQSINSVSSQASSIAAAVIPASVNSVSSQASSIAAAVIPASVNSVSSQASSVAATNPHTVSSLQSIASVASFTNTNWATVSSANSRVKSSFSW